MSEKIAYVTDDTFESEVVNAEGPVLVDYWADWCGPCRQLSPIVERLAERYEGQLDVRKVDVDHQAELAGHYGVRGIPTLVLFKNGAPVASRVGVAPERELTTLVESHLD